MGKDREGRSVFVRLISAVGSASSQSIDIHVESAMMEMFAPWCIIAFW